MNTKDITMKVQTERSLREIVDEMIAGYQREIDAHLVFEHRGNLVGAINMKDHAIAAERLYGKIAGLEDLLKKLEAA